MDKKQIEIKRKQSKIGKVKKKERLSTMNEDKDTAKIEEEKRKERTRTVLSLLLISLLVLFAFLMMHEAKKQGNKAQNTLNSISNSTAESNISTEENYQHSDITRSNIKIYQLTSSENSEYMLSLTGGTLLPLGKDLPEYLIITKRLSDTGNGKGEIYSKYIMLIGDRLYTLTSTFDSASGNEYGKYKQIEAYEITDETDKSNIKEELFNNKDKLVKIKLSEIMEEKTLIE